MTFVNPTPPVTDDELARLGQLLEKAGPTAMNLEKMDGYLSALVCTPELVMPSDYLSQVFGEGKQFDDEGEVREVIGLIFRHWNDILTELQAGLIDPKELRYPVLSDDESETAGYDWACGFMEGVRQYHVSYSEIMNDEKHGGAILPMMMFSHERDTNPKTRTPPITPEKREQALAMMIAGLNGIYRYFETDRNPDTPRSSASSKTIRRSAPKVGRNERCPCGSGKKFKHCCAQSKSTLH
jgi:uncharacterized protein